MIKYTEEDLRDHDAIGAVIKDSKGRILMQDHVKYSFWTIPIGKAKQGQTPEDALKQELHEECGISVKKFRKIAEKDYVYVRDGKNVRLTSHIYEISKYDGDIENREPSKHRAQEFKSVEEIMKFPYISDATVLYLETIGFNRQGRI